MPPELSAQMSTISPDPKADPARGPSTIAALASNGAEEREAAWAAFVATYTPLLLRVMRTIALDHDAAMDMYTFALGQLREGEFRRLLAYHIAPDCSFETWLAVVARRLALDHHRSKYGRVRSDESAAKDAQRERRRLVDLVAEDVAPELATADPDPASQLEKAELLHALEASLTTLAPKDKLLLRYRFGDDLPAREIARLLQFPTVFHVYRRVNALLAACRGALQQRGFGARDA